MAEKKARFKPFPKVKDVGSGKSRIDYEQLKELYLSGPDYDWTPFCRRNNFNDRIAKNHWSTRFGFDFKDWKRDWIKQQISDHDAEIAPEVVALRKQVSLTRIKFVKKWNDRTEYMLAMLDAMLTRHGQDLQYDHQNADFIAKNPDVRRFKMRPTELGDLAATALKIQDLQMKSLLLVTQSANNQQDALEDIEGERDGDLAKPVMQISTMGEAGLNAAESAKILAAWFDQADRAAIEVKPEEEEMPDEGD